MAYLQGLNAAQRDAVTTTANVVQVLAPPGSGKTKTLTSRVAHLLQERKYSPWNVICVTFTIKSSREMNQRLCRLIGEDTGKKVILGTFHSVCRRYLSSYGHLIHIPQGFGIADSSDTIGILKRIVKRLNLTIEAKVARSRISSCKSKNMGPEQLWEEMIGNKKQQFVNVDKQELIAAYEEYEADLRAANLLDYDDLLLRTVQLLQQYPGCVKNVQAVLIDEFQDTNNVQFELMRLFARHCNCITTVGDPDQGIYGWRNAELGNLNKMYELWPNASVINLEQNYRSAGCILESAQMLIEQDTVRPQKALVPTHRNGTKPVLRHLPTPENESEWIVSEIQRWMTLSAGLLSHSDFAILLRSSPLSRQIEGAMGKAGIPYRMVGGTRFFDRVEVKIMLDYLRVVAQPDNSDALSRIINIPSRRIGDTTIRGLLEESAGQGCSLWTVIKKSVQGSRKTSTKVTAKQSIGLASISSLIVQARAKVESEDSKTGPKELLEFILENLDFKDYLEKEYKEDHELRWENVNQLLIQADDFSLAPSATGHDNDESLPVIDEITQQSSSPALSAVYSFLSNVALATEVENKSESSVDGKPRQTVTISTMHSAKGLEWPIVFIPACYTGSIPHSRAEDGDEERRILYVGMTRAQAMLNLSVPRRGFHGGSNEVSSFLSGGNLSASFEKSAPLLDFALIEDVAAILGRKPPSKEKMAEGVKACKHLLDDRWSLDGEPDPEEVAKQWVGVGNSYGYKTAQEGFSKRRRISSEGGENGAEGSVVTSTTFTKTTMQSSQSFTVPPPGATGFVSAATQMHIQQMNEEAEQKQREKERGQKAATSTRAKLTRHESGPKLNKAKRATGQSSLMSWFKRGKEASMPELGESPPPVLKEDTTPASSLDSTGLNKRVRTLDRAVSLDEAMDARRDADLPPEQVVIDLEATDTSHPPVPQTAASADRPFRPVKFTSIPQTATRRPLNGKDAKQADDSSSGYKFLSSSPPPAEIEEQSRDEQGGIASSHKDVCRGERESPPLGFQPASTMHKTTLGRVTAGGGGGNGGTRPGQQPRRRLGMGGPMKPWKV